MKLSNYIPKLSLLAIIATTFFACKRYDNPPEFQPPNIPQEKIITIKELKLSLWNPDLRGVGDTFNFLRTYFVSTAVGCDEPPENVIFREQYAHASEIKEDFYIKGRVISDDRQGNFFRQLFIQCATAPEDEATGIVVKLGSSGLYNFYDVGQIVYIKLQNLILGFYRGMYEIGYWPDVETYFPTSFIDAPTLVKHHVLAGDPSDLQPVKPRKVTVAELTQYLTFDNFGNPQISLGNLRNDMLMGTLITITDLEHQSTDPFLGNMYPNYVDASGKRVCGTRARRTGVNVKPGLPLQGDNNVIKTWALNARDLQKLGGEAVVRPDTAIVYFLKGDLPDTVAMRFSDDKPDGLIFVPSNVAATVSHYYNDESGSNFNVVVRTSGFARFAGLPYANRASFTGIIGVYGGRQTFPRHNAGSSSMVSYTDYQLTIRSLADVVK